MKKIQKPYFGKNSLTILVTKVFFLSLLFLIIAQSEIYAQAVAPSLPIYTEFNVASTTTANPVLNSDITTFGPNDYRVIGFINDHAGVTGDDLLLTIVDNPGTYYQLIIKPSDVDNNAVFPPGFTNSISLFSPDIALMNNANSVSAILVFNTWDNTNVGWMMQVDFNMTTHIFTINANLNQPVNFGTGPWGGQAFYPVIDGDHLSNPQRVAVSYLNYSNTVFTSYFDDNGTSYVPMAGGGYSNIPSTIPVASGHYISDIDVAMSRETTIGLPASVVSYIDNDYLNHTATLKVDYLPASNPGFIPVFSSGLNQLLSTNYLGATSLLPSPIFPRICAQPEYDWNLQNIMQYSVVVGSLDGSLPPIAPHLFYGLTDVSGNWNTYYFDSPNSFGQSENFLPALDWMSDPFAVIGTPSGNLEDAFIAWRGFININPPGSGSTDGIYGIMTPFLPTAPAPYTDWFQINKLGISGTKVASAVASNPIFKGYVVSWYDQGKIFYKVNFMGTANFKNSNLYDENNKSNLTIDAFPNPAKSRIRFNFKNSHGEFRIYNLSGTIIFSGIYNDKFLDFDVSQLSDGLYMISDNESNSIFTVKH